MSNITISSGVTSTGPSAGPGDTITVLEGGTAISAQVSGYNSVSGTEIVFGSSVDAVVYAGGLEVISAGGSDSFSTISGGSQVDYGTTTGDTFLTGGGGTTYGVSFDVTISGGATLVVQSGGVISGGLDEGGIFVQSDGSAVSTTIGSGGAISLDGCSATGLMVSGVEYNFSGSTTGTLVESGGIEYIYSGGVASGAVIGSDGAQYVYSGGSATGTVVSSGGFQYVASGGAAADAIVSSGGTEYVFSGGIVSGTTLETGGTIDLTNLAFVSSGLGSLDGSDNLTATEGASSQTISLAGNYSGENFQLSPDGSGGTDVMLTELCYLRGTHILTPTGETCIEDLRIGDDVVTRFNGIQPIKWIGRQSYPGAVVKANREKAAGVRPGRRARRPPPGPRTSTSRPDIPCWWATISSSPRCWSTASPSPRTGPRPRVDYFQIELDAHDCVIAEGAWAETYADFEELRGQFHNVAEFHALYPDYQTPEELSLCAPRPERGAKLGEALRPRGGARPDRRDTRSAAWRDRPDRLPVDDQGLGA